MSNIVKYQVYLANNDSQTDHKTEIG
jgi:hypothetical protein